jgi:hypothetical protein
MNNVYGTKRPANITPDDVEIFYYYRPNRAEEDSSFGGVFKTLDSSSVLSKAYCETDNGDMILPGMYNLTLPVNEFNKKGIYTVYIKPKEIRTTIENVGPLYSFPSVKGIILKESNINGLSVSNGSLVGYRVEYIDNDGNREEDFRVITSNNRACPTQTGNGTEYIFNDNTNFIFCTLTPSTGNSFKTNSLPYIGEPGKEIVLINTKFNPICLEVEMVEHDDETISWMLEGDQIINRENSIITTFNDKGEIYHQSKNGRVTDVETGIAHDVRFKVKNNIDFSEGDKIEDIKTSFNENE